MCRFQKDIDELYFSACVYIPRPIANFINLNLVQSIGCWLLAEAFPGYTPLSILCSRDTFYFS